MNKNNYFEITYKLINLSIPLILVQSVQAITIFVSFIFIAHIGKNALAASALATLMYRILIVFFWGGMNSISILTARKQSMDSALAKISLLTNAMFYGLMISLVLLILLMLAPYILIMTHQAPSIQLLATSYLHGICWAIIPSTLMIVLEQFLIGQQRARLILLISLIQMPCQLALIYVFMLSMHHGLAAVGYAMAIVNSGLLIGLAIYLAKELGINIADFTLYNASKVKKMLQLGWPIGSQYAGE
ncbi:MAG: hypothetical protein JKY13_03835 [Gammaproteobacteria bacterium]|nr:hypothetical protein [Gammaproteobacteria bacterium]